MITVKNKKNIEVIDFLELNKQNVKNALSKGKYKSYNSNNIEISSNEILINGSKLTKSAETKILKYLGLARTYRDVSKKMDPIDWSTIADKFCTALSSQNFYAAHKEVAITVDSNNSNEPKKTEIDEILIPSLKSDSNRINSRLMSAETADTYTNTVIDTIIESIAESDSVIKVHKTSRNIDNNMINFNFEIEDFKLNVFNSGIDEWTKGSSISFNNHEFDVRPFVNRLVCTNGAMVPFYSYNSNTLKHNFLPEKIKKEIKKAFSNNILIDAVLFERINKMREFNLSVAELHSFAKIFANSLNDENYGGNQYLQKMFDDSYLTVAYGIPIKEMPPQMKKTADTGKNAYRFFNDLTWVASHREESKLSKELCQKLQIEAGNFLIKKQFDMSLVAPKPVIAPRSIQYISE